MNFVCIVFELGDKMLTLSSMENLIVPCNLEGVGGDTLGSTLALPASWAEVGGANGGASDFAES